MNEQPEKSREFIENFIVEELEIQNARNRGDELGSDEPSSGSGAFLQTLALALRAKSVVELGTGTGVGTLWLAGGVDESGTITSIDREAEYIQLAREACEEMEISTQRVRLIHGSPYDILQKLTDSGYDMIVVRDFSGELSELVDHSHRILRTGGVCILVHALHGGKVADLAQRDEVTVARRELLRNLRADRERWTCSLNGLGDGIFIAVKN
jgi:predicted O-methyltransferase YrrM